MSMMQPIYRFEFTPTYAQYLQFLRYTARRQARWLRPFAVVALISFIFAPLLPFVDSPTVAAKYQFCLKALILPGVVFLIVPLIVSFSAKKRWNMAAELRAPKSYEFSDAGLSVAGDTFQGFTKWENIVRVETTGSLILLYSAQSGAYLIPAESFGGSEQVESFKEFLRKHVLDCKRLGQPTYLGP